MLKSALTVTAIGLLIASVNSGTAQAALLNFTINGSNELGTIELEGGQIVNGTDLINVTVTDVDDPSLIVILQDGSTTAPTDRTTLMSDLRLDTGFANVESVEFTFNTPIVNRAGIDLLVFDYGGFTGQSRDDFVLTTPNSATQTYTNVTGVSNGTDLFTELADATTAITNVAELQASGFTNFRGSVAGDQGVLGIELSDFGYAQGDTVASFVLTTSNTDPVLILGIESASIPIPEPASVALVGLGGLCLLSRRRR